MNTLAKKTNKQEATTALNTKKSTASRSNVNNTTNVLDDVLELHHTLGNANVQKIFHTTGIQAKLNVSQPNDPFEQEAQRVADEIVTMPDSKVQEKSPISVQRKRATSSGSSELSSKTESQINSLGGRGESLSPQTRAFFEPRFGHDFSNVRIHTDSSSSDLAQSINAKAFTKGNHIVFNNGQYTPNTLEGKKLLGHELTHVVQQKSNFLSKELQRTIGDGHDLQSSRFSKDSVLEACYDDEQYLKKGAQGEAVKKVQKTLVDAGFPLPKYGADGKFGSETKRAVIMFQKAFGFSGKDADGIIGPKTMKLLDENVGAVPNKWAEYLKEGLKKLWDSNVGSRFPGSGPWKYDTRYWTKVRDPDYTNVYTPKSGKTPAVAVEKLFDHLDLWEFDCAIFPEVAQLYAYQRSLSAALFNSKFSGLRLKVHDTTGIQRAFYDVDYTPVKEFNTLWNNAPVGSKVMWTNKSSAATNTDWKNENAIKTKKSASWKDDRYDAQPLGYNLSEPQVKLKLAATTSDWPSSGVAARLKYVKDNIYRHQLHIIINKP